MKRIVMAIAIVIGCASAQKPTPPPARTPTPAPSGGCWRAGCSDELCTDHTVISTCEYRYEYACLAKAICERQPDGKCGWTQTDASRQCLDQIRQK